MVVCSTPITVTVRRVGERPEYPEWLVAIAEFLGITPEQARMVIIGVISLIGLVIVISILR